MASPQELSGGEPRSPYAAEVSARNTRIGDHYHSERAKEFTKQLEELAVAHPELINVEHITLAADQEGQVAGEAAIVQRENGLMNDMQSKAPGIFVSGNVDYEAFEAMKEEFRIYDVPYELEILDHSNPTAPYLLHLPQGAFRCQIEEGLTNQEHLSVYSKAEFELDGSDFRPLAGGTHLLTSGYIGHTHIHGTISRIEGAGGRIAY